jgi:antitoxin component of RelBE/YafQ-DinJ toxin-antitoxin module
MNSAAKKRGRPLSEKPKRTQINFRVDDESRDALKKYRDKLGVVGLTVSDAARDLMTKALQREGLLPK